MAPQIRSFNPFFVENSTKIKHMNSMKRIGKMRDWAKDQRELDELLGFTVFCFRCRYNFFDWEVKPKTVRLNCQHCKLIIPR